MLQVIGHQPIVRHSARSTGPSNENLNLEKLSELIENTSEVSVLDDNLENIKLKPRASIAKRSSKVGRNIPKCNDNESDDTVVRSECDVIPTNRDYK